MLGNRAIIKGSKGPSDSSEQLRMFSVLAWTLAWTFIRQAAEQKRIPDAGGWASKHGGWCSQPALNSHTLPRTSAFPRRLSAQANTSPDMLMSSSPPGAWQMGGEGPHAEEDKEEGGGGGESRKEEEHTEEDLWSSEETQRCFLAAGFQLLNSDRRNSGREALWRWGYTVG